MDDKLNSQDHPRNHFTKQLSILKMPSVYEKQENKFLFVLSLRVDVTDERHTPLSKVRRQNTPI